SPLDIVVCFQSLERLLAHRLPENLSPFDALHARDEAPHAVPYKDHLIKCGACQMRVDRLSHRSQVGTHLGGAHPERLSRWVKVEPELIVLAYEGIAAEVVVHL